MKDVLGVLMLSGIIPVFIWLVACLMLVAFVIKPTGGIFRRVLTKLFVFILLLFLPFSDEIFGRAYFKSLCKNKTRVIIYQTVELPEKYWDSNGDPKYFASNGFVDMRLLPEKYRWNTVDEPYIKFPIKITKSRWQFVDKDSDTVLGERITYIRLYGWLNRFSTAPNIAESCRNLDGETNNETSREDFIRKEVKQEQEFFQSIFKP
jgi:hypothetical protein